jgi:hypothetical protein
MVAMRLGTRFVQATCPCGLLELLHNFYLHAIQKAVSYWDQQEPSYNGVLGGFGFVSVSVINIHVYRYPYFRG